MSYISGEQIADARNALGFRVPVEQIAAHMNVPVDELRAALGLPPAQPVQDSEPRVDIFAEVSADVL